MACLINTVAPVSRQEAVNMRESAKCLAEYIWIGGGSDLKSRTVVLDERPASAEELPLAEIDGSAYGLSSEEQCEVYLQPRKIFADPFRGGDHILVLCDTYVPPLPGTTGAHCLAAGGDEAWDNMPPHATNHRAACEAVMQQAAYHQPLFAVQQEYSLYSSPSVCGSGCGGADAASPGSSQQPFFPNSSLPGLPGISSRPPLPGAAPLPIKGLPAGLSSKASARLGRDVAELHMQACIAAGLAYSGSHSATPCQWAYKLGPCGGLEVADQLCLSRFLLARVAEHQGAAVWLDGCGDPGGEAAAALYGNTTNKCVISFSTATSRDPLSGLHGVQVMMERMRASHEAFMHNGGGAAAPSHSAAATTVAAGGGGSSPHLVRHHLSGGSWHSALDAFRAAPHHHHHHDHDGPNSAAGAFSGSGGGGGGSSLSSGMTVGVGNKHASIMVPTSTLINGCGPILDRRPPASADPYLSTSLLMASACGLQLPLPQVSATQLAAAMAAAAAAAARAAVSATPAVPIAAKARNGGGAASRRGGSVATREGSFSSLGSGPYSCSSYGSSMLCSSADSHEVLLSALDRIDGYDHQQRSPHGLKRRHVPHGCDDDEVCSDASSPPLMMMGRRVL